MNEKELHIIVLWGVSVGLLTDNKKSANKTCKRTAKTIWNSSLVTQSVPIFINLQTTYVALVIIFMLLWFFTEKEKRGYTLSIKSGYCPCLLAHTVRHIWGLYLHRWSVCFFFIDQFLIFLLWVFFSFLSYLGAAIGYLMHIFFISLHFLYDKGATAK